MITKLFILYFDIIICKQKIKYLMHAFTVCGSARHKDMLRTFWRTNHIRNPKTPASGSGNLSERVSLDGQKVSYTILQDYQNDIKKRFRMGDAPSEWKELLESQKPNSKRATVKSCSDESVTVSSVNADESLKLQTLKMPNSSASPASTLEWRMETFLLSSEDYQRYAICSCYSL